MFILADVLLRSHEPDNGLPIANTPAISDVSATDLNPSERIANESNNEENLSPWDVRLSVKKGSFLLLLSFRSSSNSLKRFSNSVMNSSMRSSATTSLAVSTCFDLNCSNMVSVSVVLSSIAWMRKFVIPDMADTTTTFFPFSLVIILADLIMASADPTLVPPNFKTVIID